MIDHDKEFAKPMRQLRCVKCHRRLLDEFVVHGRIAIKCWGKDCGELNRFVFRDYRNAKMKTGEQSPTFNKIKE